MATDVSRGSSLVEKLTKPLELDENKFKEKILSLNEKQRKYL